MTTKQQFVVSTDVFAAEMNQGNNLLNRQELQLSHLMSSERLKNTVRENDSQFSAVCESATDQQDTQMCFICITVFYV